MSIDTIFILAAGMGSRMGKIGEVLPKPLWPLFNHTLFSATVAFWKSKGFKNFYANVHHGAKDMIAHLESLGVTPLYEKKLLGSGGAFHNLKYQHPNIDRVFSVNCDSFLLGFNEGVFHNQIKSAETSLFSMPVRRNEKYNRLILRSENLVEIKRDFSSDGVTYSGAGIINLERVKTNLIESSFFDTVANYKNNQIKVISGAFTDFLDFGTLKNYFNSKFLLVAKQKNHSLIRDCGLVVEPYIKNGNIVYQGDKETKAKKSIIICSGDVKRDIDNCIVYKEIIEKI